MLDDEFDRDLAVRLRAYESRIPQEEAPDPLAIGRRGTGWPILAAGGAAAVAAVTLAAVVLLNAVPSNVGEESPTPSTDGSPSASASASPTVTPATEPSASVEPTSSATIQPASMWQEAAMFGDDGAVDRVQSVTRGAGGFVAVGIHYPEGAPFLVAVPQEGRIWQSSDGRSWEDVTPPDTFADANLTGVFEAADGALIAHGRVATDDSGTERPMAWESVNGRTWSATSLGFPDESEVADLVRGAQGYLAMVSTAGVRDLWLSSDGRTWEIVRAGGPTGAESFLDIGAGDEGFVALGTRGEGDAIETIAIASSDGHQWIEATVPPAGAGLVISRGGDWIASGRTDVLDILGVRNQSGCLAEPSDERVWSSANGLEWTEIGSIPWQPGAMDPTCWYVSANLHAAGSWLISSASLAPGPCCDIILVPGIQQISSDGRSWEALPFPAAEEGRLGSSVNDAIAEGDLLILVGRANNRAAFWFNEAP